jgi:hypothetical protein
MKRKGVPYLVLLHYFFVRIDVDFRYCGEPVTMVNEASPGVVVAGRSCSELSLHHRWLVARITYHAADAKPQLCSLDR